VGLVWNCARARRRSQRAIAQHRERQDSRYRFDPIGELADDVAVGGVDGGAYPVFAGLGPGADGCEPQARHSGPVQKTAEHVMDVACVQLQDEHRTLLFDVGELYPLFVRTLFFSSALVSVSNGIYSMLYAIKQYGILGMRPIQRKDAQRLDETDRRILREMQQNARLTTADLADKVGLSTTPCWNRLKRLEKQGYIDGYVALLNQEKLGLPETVIIEVTLDRHDEEVLEHFGQLLTGLPEVIEAYLTTGDYDYLVKVAVESPSGYERFLREKLYRIPGIRHSRSSFALRCLKKLTSVQV